MSIAGKYKRTILNIAKVGNRMVEEKKQVCTWQDSEMQGTKRRTGRHSSAPKNMAQRYSYCCIRNECLKLLIFVMKEQGRQHLLLSTGNIKQLDSLINSQLLFSGIC